jgi:predicted nucleotidyltransferase component of viral defense system
MLSAQPWISEFFLAGGTALALRLGHRISVDLDFFTTNPFEESALVEKLASLGNLEVFQKSTQSMTGSLNEVKCSFLRYGYPLLRGCTEFHGIRIASIEDIACMKLDALSSRGTKRDFVDVFMIARQIPLPEMISLFERKYASVHFNLLHLKKSLVYFDDAESDVMPQMLEPVTWDQVKQFFLEASYLV